MALVTADGDVLAREIVAAERIGPALAAVCRERSPGAVVVGNRTGHELVMEAVRAAQAATPVHLIDETDSTLEARDLYFADNPPRGWRRLVPVSLQYPPQPFDDYAAVVLARRFLLGASR
jgi:hypothetical protein